jgi:hypothetical protein
MNGEQTTGAVSVRSSGSRLSWKSATTLVGKFTGALRLGRRDRAVSEYTRRD